jgi:hypothetical protein
MQGQSIARAAPAPPPLYPARFAQAVPQRSAPYPRPEPTDLTREMLRAIVIEQIG